MTIAEKREIVNTIINLLLQLTAEEEVQEQPATSSKPVKAPAQSVRMLTIKECTALIEGISEHSIRMLIAQGKIKAFRTGEGVRGKYLVNKEEIIGRFVVNIPPCSGREVFYLLFSGGPVRRIIRLLPFYCDRMMKCAITPLTNPF